MIADFSEASLWKKLSNTLLQLINYKPQSRGMYFNVLARLCNLVPLLTRYAPHSTHGKCHGGKSASLVFRNFSV